jgi:hypothetical protein
MPQSAKSKTHMAGSISGRSNAILGISPVRPLDLIGPPEVFMEANRLRGDTFYCVTFLSGAKDTAILSPLALTFSAGSSYLDDDSSFDTLLVAGGEGARGPGDAHWVKTTSLVSSICQTRQSMRGKEGIKEIAARRRISHDKSDSGNLEIAVLLCKCSSVLNMQVAH